jgi:2-polyprenyl-3-methyl-5-hydroxy-6-metoxy-1,4-benzoquinol methylase
MEDNNMKSIIKDANKSYYNNAFEVEDYIKKPYHALREKIAILELVRRIKNEFPYSNDKINVLEIAGATGTTAMKIKEQGYNVCVSDNHEVPLKIAEERGLTCVQFDAEGSFPFQNDSFHALFAGEIIEHIFDIEGFMSECNRVLKKNGIIVITTPNLAAFQDRILFLFGKSPRHIDPLHQYRKLHIRPFTKSNIFHVFNKSGFKKCKVKSNYVRIQIGEKFNILNRLFAKIFPSLGGTLIVSAIKRDE